MKIGHARINITPKEGTEFYLLGYKTPARNAPAKGIHDPIFANAILFDHGAEQVFLWTADLLELPDDTAADIKLKLSEEFGINRDHIILGVTHDHSSIRDFHRDWEFGKYSPEYDEFFRNSVLEAYRKCLANAQNATARIGSKVVTGYYSNRNHKGELADNTVQVLRFYNEKEEAFAAIVNWAVHSTAMGASNLYLTGDIAGNTCRKLGLKWGYYPVMVNGAAGDCSNHFDRKGKDFHELERVTDGLAEEIAGIESDRPVNLGEIQKITLSHDIVTDMDAYHKVLKDTIQKVEKGLCRAGGSLPPSHLIEKCEEQLKQPPFKLSLAFEVLDIGELRFDIFPGELASKFGIELREAFEKPVIVAGYANGFHYYFLNKEEYGKSFETIGNPVPPGEPEKIVEKMIDAGKLLDKISDHKMVQECNV